MQETASGVVVSRDLDIGNANDITVKNHLPWYRSVKEQECILEILEILIHGRRPFWHWLMVD